MANTCITFCAAFLSMWLSSSVAEYLFVGKDVAVLTNNNAILKCTGLKKELRFYIDHKICWTYNNTYGKRIELTNGNNLIEFDAFNRGDYNYSYAEMGPNGFEFHLKVNHVTQRDVGTYTCSIRSKDDDILEAKSLTLDIVNPVQRIEIALLNASSDDIVTSTEVVEHVPKLLQPGSYNVRCDAYGSIPEPTILLYLDDKLIYDNARTNRDSVTSLSNGTFVVNGLELIPQFSTQRLLCSANIPLGDFQPMEAGILVNISKERLGFVCADVNASVGDVGVTIRCTIFRPDHSKHSPLVCNKVTWIISSQNSFVAEMSAITKNFAHVSGNSVSTDCLIDPDTSMLTATLVLESVRPSDFELTYSLVYGDLRYGPRSDRKLRPVPSAYNGSKQAFEGNIKVIVMFVFTTKIAYFIS